MPHLIIHLENNIMKRFATALLVLHMLPALANTTVPDVKPAAKGHHVVINIPQQRLFLYNNGKLSKIYPVAVGKARTQTVIGAHKIGAKAYNPTWHIPKSIQKERGGGVTTVPPGPRNPLGPVFVRLGDPKLGLGIHGTNAPASVPGVRSHGCVRMKSPDALQFAKTVSSGSPADVIYQLAALNVDSAGNLWLAAYRDPYNKKNLDTAALRKSIAAWAQANGKTVSDNRVSAILKSRTGAPNCLTCGTGKGKGKGKISGELKSLAWLSGSGSLSRPKAAATDEPLIDQTLPEGSGIEVDADDVPQSDTAQPLLPSTPVSPRAASDVTEEGEDSGSNLF